MKYRLEVNGQRREVDVAPDTPLLWVLREDLSLVGTKYGCGVAQCGACTVLVAGRATRACVMPIAALENRPVTTIEGVEGAVATAVQESWESIQVPQCGYCQSGQIMTAIALLERKAKPDDDDIDSALAGNICRCATYPRIRRAVHEAAAKAGRSA
jgi:isoquinoline 1-oxidoreductase alpha subunit